MSAKHAKTTSASRGHYGVLGHDIGYTRSPHIFKTVFDALDWTATYDRYDLTANRLRPFLDNAAATGLVGLNVTKPYKERVLRVCSGVDQTVRLIGAANTLRIRDSGIDAFNTDIDGVIAALRRYRRPLHHATTVILGAGGAARAVAYTLAEYFAAAGIIVSARTGERAQKLVSQFQSLPGMRVAFAARRWGSEALRDAIADADLIVNATPIGSGSLRGRSPLPPRMRLDRRQIVFDLVYAPARTALLKRAEQSGCRGIVGGWAMLVAQAEASFAIWTGRRFPADARHRLLREVRT